MKTRIKTGILIFLFVLPFVLFGGNFMMAFVLLLLGIGVYEFLSVMKKAFLDEIPIYIYIISMIFGFLIIFDLPIYCKGETNTVLQIFLNNAVFDYSKGVLSGYVINPIWLIAFIFTLFTCSVFDKKFKITYAMYTFSTVLYLSLGLKGMLYLRSLTNIVGDSDTNSTFGLVMLAYVLLVTCATDIFAYFGGMTCYKLLGEKKVHKLNERISPKKTIEGTIVGTTLATILGFFFGIYFIDNGSYDKWYLMLLLSFMLSICGQIGDLLLSALKRHYRIKDFSNLLPGHGGVLDRIDSVLINSMVAALFMALTFVG